MKHKHLNQVTSTYQSDSRTDTSEPPQYKQFEAKQPDSREHISRLDLDIINEQVDLLWWNLSISPIKIVYAYRINTIPTTSTATMCIRKGVYESRMFRESTWRKESIDRTTEYIANKTFLRIIRHD